MANTFYSPNEHRAARVNALFSRVASRYDLMNDLQSFGLHRYWKHKVVALAQPLPGKTAIDVCCGTGDITFSLAHRGATVVGLDFTQAMLDVAEHRRIGKPPGQGSIQFVRGDAQQLPFPDNGFDVVTMGYGLRNLAGWELGLQEMNRVAKPGGRIVILEFGKPDNAIWRTIYYGYLRAVVPLLGLVFCGSAAAYAYILESLKQYPAQHGVAARMRALAMENVRIVSLLGGVMSINYGEKSRGGSPAP
jgi:demethylmenaquinone methyltransferase/2-methoxy-6-polyprenyl-1,4-benzoquinol methylase